MKTFKIKPKIIFAILLFIFSTKILTAQALKQNFVIKFKCSFLPYTAQIRMPALSKITVENYFETSAGGKSYRGKMLEPIAREIYKNNFARNFKSLDATYNNGTNGLDGLFVKFDSRKNIRKVHVVEIKSGNAQLNKFNKQMSKKWINSGINKSILEKEKNLVKLRNKISAERNPIKRMTLKNEFKNLNNERKYLNKAKTNIQYGNYERYLVRIDYLDGKIKVIQQKILKETKFNDVITGTPKILSEFSYLDKDALKLNSFQRQIKETIFNEFDEGLKKLGKTPEQRAAFMYELKTNPNFTSTKEFSQVELSKAAKNKIKKIQNNFNIRSQIRFIKSGILLLSVASEAKSIFDFVQNKITISDFAFASVSNMIATTSLFIEQLNPYLVPIMLTLDLTKNLWNWSRGNVNTSQAIINISSSVAGTAAFMGGAAIGATIGGSIGGGIGGFVGGVIGGSIAAGVAFISVNFIGQKIINYYEILRESKAFDLFCDDLQEYIKK